MAPDPPEPLAAGGFPLPPADPSQSAVPPPTAAVPVAIWITLQLAALALAAARIPLSAHYPTAGERWAAHLLLTAQLCGSALLFPYLFRNLRSGVVVLATSLPFTAAAGILAAHSPARTALIAAYLALWVATLFAVRVVLRSPKAQLTAAAVAIGATAGGALLNYLRSEFRSADTPDSPNRGVCGFLDGAFRLADGGEISYRVWLPLVAVSLACGGTVFAAARRAKKKPPGRISPGLNLLIF